MKTLYYDFETSGFLRRELDDPGQPHIVQMAAVLCWDGVEVSSLNLIARPDDWVIPATVAEVHGITQGIALAVGVPEKAMVQLFWRLAQLADERVAHNDDFDAKVYSVALHRFSACEETSSRWDAMPRTCTMASTTDICRLPPTQKMIAAGYNKFKSPKLEEAYRHLFGETFDGAHNAAADVRACRRIHEHLLTVAA